MPPVEQLAEARPLEEQDTLFNEIVSLVLEDDLAEDEVRMTYIGVEIMLVNFRRHLFGEPRFGFIRHGQVLEERLERQLMPYPRISKNKWPEVISILRGYVEKKITSDNEIKN